ncbi:hypothetical protein ACFSTH_05425 [Paenibacillus yanchengensis]|uniref:DUF2922 family protein n=1 Tax=Paenibacillus yanchengensis TaxID=2035833 RepID=A0ABW4YI01_9BACL
MIRFSVSIKSQTDSNVYKLLQDDLFQLAIEKLTAFPVDKLGFKVNQSVVHETDVLGAVTEREII